MSTSRSVAPAPTNRPVQSSTATRRPWSLWAATGVLLFIALGALPAGVMLMASPHGDPLGMSGAWIEATPFGAVGGWFLPGLVLFTLIGLGSLVTTWGLVRLPQSRMLQRLTLARSRHWSWTLLLLEGLVLMVWIAVQVLLMPAFFLQPVVFACGLSLVALALTPSLRRYATLQTA